MNKEIKMKTASLYDCSREGNGTHGNVQAWLSEVYAEGGIDLVKEAIAGWPSAFLGEKGVFMKVSPFEAILVAAISLSASEVEEANLEARLG